MSLLRLAKRTLIYSSMQMRENVPRYTLREHKGILHNLLRARASEIQHGWKYHGPFQLKVGYVQNITRLPFIIH